MEGSQGSEVPGIEQGTGKLGGAGQQASGMVSTERKCLLPLSALVSTDPP